ncbi:nuclear transport factor 2 family protein [Tunicatimonas pelagia]|uniref:nuclear transport factor 2 family protein n=1 Tax=Tunicatimonas pelagia TaxID=931531 RepID=UPI0026653647|nr:nuclear transport factor 2 family protein [Tunicatimonas pelagia]WKN46024.1 nuclear transport factor 2 family protein [Tunicatimonas pelagia]
MEKVINDYIEAYNSFNVPGMTEHLSDDVVFQNVSGGESILELTGKEAFKAQAEQAKNLFKSRKQTIEDVQIVGDTAEVTVDYLGVLAQDLPNGLSAGDTIQLSGKSIFHFEDGKITKLRDES